MDYPTTKWVRVKIKSKPLGIIIVLVPTKAAIQMIMHGMFIKENLNSIVRSHKPCDTWSCIPTLNNFVNLKIDYFKSKYLIDRSIAITSGRRIETAKTIISSNFRLMQNKKKVKPQLSKRRIQFWRPENWCPATKKFKPRNLNLTNSFSRKNGT